jgi:transcriptional regulator with XRE-family HTH domain
MLGLKLKELRESNGMVQRQIAALLEVDTAFISKVEKEILTKNLEIFLFFFLHYTTMFETFQMQATVNK